MTPRIDTEHAAARTEPASTAAAAADVDLSLFPGGLLHAGFLRQAAHRPEAVAVTWESAPGALASLTYAGLRAWAWRVAAWVGEQKRSETPETETPETETIVAVLLPKGWMQAAAVLGVNWAGAAYVPLDASWPAARVREVLAQTDCRAVIGTPATRAAIGEIEGVQWADLESWASGAEPEAAAGAWHAGADAAARSSGFAHDTRLAYVIYTSGSTGRPKGVMIEHGAACRTLAAVNARWTIGPADRVLALSSLSFDLSVFDLFGIWAAGGTAVLPGEGQRRDIAAWLRLADAAGVTVWNSVPALLQMAVEQLESRDAAWPSPLRLVWLSGDWIPLPLPDRLRARAPRAAVVSLGGATEAAIWSIAYEIDRADPAARADWRSVPYGTALAGQTVQVLRASSTTEPEPGDPVALTACPPWVTGRLYIGGGGLARGYWGNAEETARRFVTDATTGARLYDTGDLGRQWPDGTIELLGRADQQVKIQGYRVELGEIEATLVKHPQVAAAAVTVFDTPGGSKQLAAYIVPRDRAQEPDTTAIRKFLAEQLPPYMLPVLQVLQDLPLNANDKVDVRALPPPVMRAASASDGPVPAPLALLQQVAQEVLQGSAIGPDDNLLELGANSADILAIITRAEGALTIEVDIEAFFADPTLRGIFDRHLAERAQ